ncbi:protein FAM177A1-like isoform X1 [Clavelina lepadiformis]|uniref:protein FAM177A1-like isoform X1 n=2 Tax=Clavelina lepadiformis TaxID=159417 RepID=UPI004040FD25
MDNTTLDPVSLEESKDTAVLCPDQRFKIDKHGKVKYPRRLIHCSDGILEEYSTDEEEEEEPPLPPVDTSKLTWGPYLWYHTVQAAFSGLAVCDYLGEKLAYFFGITSPKFQYALTELDRMQEEEKEEEEIRAEERRAEEEFIVQTLGKKQVKCGDGVETDFKVQTNTPNIQL